MIALTFINFSCCPSTLCFFLYFLLQQNFVSHCKSNCFSFFTTAWHLSFTTLLCNSLSQSPHLKSSNVIIHHLKDVCPWLYLYLCTKVMPSSFLRSNCRFPRGLSIQIHHPFSRNQILIHLNLPTRDGLKTLTPKTETRPRRQPSRPRRLLWRPRRDRDETLVRPRRDRDETLRNSRPLRGVIKVISCRPSRQGWSTMAEYLHFQHDFININQHQNNSSLFK